MQARKKINIKLYDIFDTVNEEFPDDVSNGYSPSIRKWVFENFQSLFDYDLKQIKDENMEQVIFANGAANLQDRDGDKKSREHGGSKAPFMLIVQHYFAESLAEQGIKVLFDPFLLADIYDEQDDKRAGKSYQAILGELFYGELDHDHVKAPYDMYNITLLYAHAHRAACFFPNHDIFIDYYHVAPAFSAKAREFFAQEQGVLLPANVHLRLYNYLKKEDARVTFSLQQRFSFYKIENKREVKCYGEPTGDNKQYKDHIINGHPKSTTDSLYYTTARSMAVRASNEQEPIGGQNIFPALVSIQDFMSLRNELTSRSPALFHHGEYTTAHLLACESVKLSSLIGLTPTITLEHQQDKGKEKIDENKQTTTTLEFINDRTTDDRLMIDTEDDRVTMHPRLDADHTAIDDESCMLSHDAAMTCCVFGGLFGGCVGLVGGATAGYFIGTYLLSNAWLMPAGATIGASACSLGVGSAGAASGALCCDRPMRQRRHEFSYSPLFMHRSAPDDSDGKEMDDIEPQNNHFTK